MTARVCRTCSRAIPPSSGGRALYCSRECRPAQLEEARVRETDRRERFNSRTSPQSPIGLSVEEFLERKRPAHSRTKARADAWAGYSADAAEVTL